MKITVHMITLNDEKYVWWALKSSYPAVDHIVIVEGAITHTEMHDRYYRVPASDKGLSLDNTGQEIERFLKYDDPEKKVEYYPIGFVNYWEDLRNAVHQRIPSDTDLVLIQDGDCLYKPADILKAKRVFEEYPEVTEVANYCWMFIWDFRHVLKCKRRRKNFWRWCFFRYNPSMYFLNERTITFKDGSTTERQLIDFPDFLKIKHREGNNYVVYDENLLNVYHFGYVQEKERMEIQLMRKFFDPVTLKKHNLELPDLKRETLMSWLKMYHKFYTKVLIEEDEYVEEFKGEYPLDGLIQKHPYFDKPEEWFRHDEPESDPNSPFYDKGWWEW